MDGRPTLKDGGIEEVTLILNESHDQWCSKEDAKRGGPPRSTMFSSFFEGE